MYGVLCHFTPEPLARLILATIYTVMICMVLYFSFEEQAEFNYMVL